MTEELSSHIFQFWSFNILILDCTWQTSIKWAFDCYSDSEIRSRFSKNSIFQWSFKYEKLVCWVQIRFRFQWMLFNEKLQRNYLMYLNIVFAEPEINVRHSKDVVALKCQESETHRCSWHESPSHCGSSACNKYRSHEWTQWPARFYSSRLFSLCFYYLEELLSGYYCYCYCCLNYYYHKTLVTIKFSAVQLPRCRCRSAWGHRKWWRRSHTRNT